MDVTTISIIIAIVGCIVGIVGSLRNKDSKTESDAEWKGSVNAKLDIIVNMQADMNNVKATMQDHETRITILEKERKKEE